MQKKIYTSLVVLLGLLILLGSIAFAQEGGTEVTKTEAGDTVTYSLNLTPNSGIQAADFAISYKDDALEYVEMKRGPLATDSDAIMMGNHVADEKTVYVSYASMQKNEGGGTIVNLIFKKVGADSSGPVIGVDIEDLYNGDNVEIQNKSVVGDSSVATVSSGKTISTEDSGAVAVSASQETIASDRSGVSTVADADITEESQGQTQTENQTTALLSTNQILTIIVILVVLVLIAIAIILYVKRKGTLEEPVEPANKNKTIENQKNQEEETENEDRKETDDEA